MQAINIQQQLVQAQAWQEVFLARVDDYEWKAIFALGEYPWHRHDERDDCFLVMSGCLGVALSDGTVYVRAGEMLVVPEVCVTGLFLLKVLRCFCLSRLLQNNLIQHVFFCPYLVWDSSVSLVFLLINCGCF